MIPKIIHYCWLSGDPFPPQIQKCLDSWKKHLPEYEFILWDTKRFVLEDSIWVKQAFEKKKYAFAADYIRLYALYHHGGIYLDCDVEVVKDFDDLLSLPYFACTEGANIIEAGAFAAVQGLNWIKDCLDYFKDREFVKPDGTLDTWPLPQIMMKVLSKNYITKVVSKAEFLIQTPDFEKEKIFYMLPKEYFCAKDMGTGLFLKTDETYCIHHFEMSWIPKNKVWISNQKRKLIRLIGVKNVNLMIALLGLKKIKEKLSR